jgi:hypothetical protein
MEDSGEFWTNKAHRDTEKSEIVDMGPLQQRHSLDVVQSGPECGINYESAVVVNNPLPIELSEYPKIHFHSDIKGDVDLLPLHSQSKNNATHSQHHMSTSLTTPMEMTSNHRRRRRQTLPFSYAVFGMLCSVILLLGMAAALLLTFTILRPSQSQRSTQNNTANNNQTLNNNTNNIFNSVPYDPFPSQSGPSSAPSADPYPSWSRKGQDIRSSWGLVALSENATVLAVASEGGQPITTMYHWWTSASQWVPLGSPIYYSNENYDTNFTLTGWSMYLSGDGKVVACGLGILNNTDLLDDDIDNSTMMIDWNFTKALFPGIVVLHEWDGTDWKLLGDPIRGQDDELGFGSSLTLSHDGRVVAVGIPDSDAVRIFRLNDDDNDDDNWIQLGSTLRNIRNGTSSSALHNKTRFGHSVSLNAFGNRVAVGAPNDDGGNDDSTTSKIGMARIYELFENDWYPFGGDIFGTVANGETGYSISLDESGLTVVVGSPGINENVGETNVFIWTGNHWYLLGLPLEGFSADARCGSSVSISTDGTMVAIACPGYHTGRIQTFLWQSTVIAISNDNLNDNSSIPSNFTTDVISQHSWVPMADPIDVDAAALSPFGPSLSLSGSGFTLAVGSIAAYPDHNDDDGYEGSINNDNETEQVSSLARVYQLSQ